MKPAIYRWTKRIVIAIAALVLFVFLVVIPVGGSYLLTNNRFRFTERGPQTPHEVGLDVTSISFLNFGRHRASRLVESRAIEPNRSSSFVMA